MDAEKNLLVITGPTASGKTGLAIELADWLRTAVISADSRQCYTGMAIGTAQPSAAELARVRHHFINAYPVTEPLSAATFEREALRHLEEIYDESGTGIVCGGTGLYIKALCEGLDEMPETDPAVAARVEAAYRIGGLSWLQNALMKEDPRFAYNSEWQNPARLMRALSFFRSNGESILDYRSGQKKKRPFRCLKVAIDLPRELLYERINQRVDQMMEAGLEAEARAMLPFRNYKALHTVGYSEMFDYFDGHCSLETAIEKIRQHTRNYAKRQLTWLRKDPNMKWLSGDPGTFADQVKALLK
jgi:tRNA dimethylallyltransferase